MRVTIRQDGRERQLLRQPGGEWTLAPGSLGQPNPFALEETMFRLGDLRAETWLARGENAREEFGFTTNSYQFTIDLKEGDKTRTVAAEFGGASPLTFPYAATIIDGQPWIFEFPPFLWVAVQRYLNLSAAAHPLQPAQPGGLGAGF
jgi:hypothetical protein